MLLETKSIRLNILHDTILQRLKAAQEDGALTIPLNLGNKTKVVTLEVPLAFIVGDIQGGDGICGRFATYKSEIRHSKRVCIATPQVCSLKKLNSVNY